MPYERIVEPYHVQAGIEAKEPMDRVCPDGFDGLHDGLAQLPAVFFHVRYSKSIEITAMHIVAKHPALQYGIEEGMHGLACLGHFGETMIAGKVLPHVTESSGMPLSCHSALILALLRSFARDEITFFSCI